MSRTNAFGNFELSSGSHQEATKEAEGTIESVAMLHNSFQAALRSIEMIETMPDRNESILQELYASLEIILSDNGLHATNSHCRNMSYGFLRMPLRAPVADVQVPWTVKMPDYSPVQFSVVVASENGSNLCSLVTENMKDAARAKPLNPIGRTGIMGRGQLLRFGPNYRSFSLHLILKSIDDGAIEQPKVLVTSDRLQRNTVSLPDIQTLPRSSFSGSEPSEVIYRGYFDSPLNTDNAWEEIEIHLHKLRQSEYADEPMVNGCDWMNLDDIHSVIPHHNTFIVQMLLRKFGSYRTLVPTLEGHTQLMEPTTKCFIYVVTKTCQPKSYAHRTKTQYIDSNTMDFSPYGTLQIMRGCGPWALLQQDEFDLVVQKTKQAVKIHRDVLKNVDVYCLHIPQILADEMHGQWSDVNRLIDLPGNLKDILVALCEVTQAAW